CISVLNKQVSSLFVKSRRDRGWVRNGGGACAVLALPMLNFAPYSMRWGACAILLSSLRSFTPFLILGALALSWLPP
ncbi:MAG TPA: hypothetical protein VE843_00285, partial [Ktedonobacteraceae bacterium]|nr:hypothetical protein [Ktedonobacteraceae bacterium]